MRFIAAVAGLAATIGMVGCLERPEPRSAIVQKAQDAGAGDLSRRFERLHPTVAGAASFRCGGN